MTLSLKDQDEIRRVLNQIGGNLDPFTRLFVAGKKAGIEEAAKALEAQDDSCTEWAARTVRELAK